MISRNKCKLTKKIKYNHHNKFNTRHKYKSNKTIHYGGSALVASLGKFVFNPNPPKQTTQYSLNSITSIINPKHAFASIIYNRKSSNEINIANPSRNQNLPLNGTLLLTEPYVFTTLTLRYLLILVYESDTIHSNELMWAIECSNHIKHGSSIFPYYIHKNGNYKYLVKIFNYPPGIFQGVKPDVPMYRKITKGSSDIQQYRNEEYINIMKFINNPQNKITLAKQYTLLITNINKRKNIHKIFKTSSISKTHYPTSNKISHITQKLV